MWALPAQSVGRRPRGFSAGPEGQVTPGGGGAPSLCLPSTSPQIGALSLSKNISAVIGGDAYFKHLIPCPSVFLPPPGFRSDWLILPSEPQLSPRITPQAEAVEESYGEGYKYFEILGPKVPEKNGPLGSPLGGSSGPPCGREWPGRG